MKHIQTAIIGTGFMGRVHLEALRRLPFVRIAAIAGRTEDAARRVGEGFAVDQITADFGDVLRNPGIDAVHICTPNSQHFAIVKECLRAGKHVLCEKPLGTSMQEAEQLVLLASERNLRNCVCHNLRFYPMVQQMRSLREAGELGEVLLVQGTYFQDWLLYETDWNWRVDSTAGGPSRAMADIGSHWFDMAEHITGIRVTSLCGDLQTFHGKRRSAKNSVETFSNKPLLQDDYVEHNVDTEDCAEIIFRMGERTRGGFAASQVSAGRKNRLSIEVFGTKSSVGWNQERPDELWVGRRDTANQMYIKDPALLSPAARAYADLPGGHSEGYDDTFKQIFRRFYSSIMNPDEPREYPQFADGLRQLIIVSAALQSSASRSWIDIPA